MQERRLGVKFLPIKRSLCQNWDHGMILVILFLFELRPTVERRKKKIKAEYTISQAVLLGPAWSSVDFVLFTLIPYGKGAPRCINRTVVSRRPEWYTSQVFAALLKGGIYLQWQWKPLDVATVVFLLQPPVDRLHSTVIPLIWGTSARGDVSSPESVYFPD